MNITKVQTFFSQKVIVMEWEIEYFISFMNVFILYFFFFNFIKKRMKDSKSFSGKLQLSKFSEGRYKHAKNEMILI